LTTSTLLKLELKNYESNSKKEKEYNDKKDKEFLKIKKDMK
jgi:hypothetical protein